MSTSDAARRLQISEDRARQKEEKALRKEAAVARRNEKLAQRPTSAPTDKRKRDPGEEGGDEGKRPTSSSTSIPLPSSHEASSSFPPRPPLPASRGVIKSSSSSSSSMDLASPPTSPGVLLLGCGSSFSQRHHLPTLLKLHASGAIRLRALSSRSSSSVSKVLSTLKKNGFKDVDSLVTHVSSADEACDVEAGSFEFPHLPTELFSDIAIVLMTLPSQVTVPAISFLRRFHPHLHIVTEKPACSSPSDVSRLLSSLGSSSSPSRCGGVYVLENWLNKPSYASFLRSFTHNLFAQGQKSIIRYELRLRQLRDDGCEWRKTLDGGALRDVGVHAARLLRETFGQITALETKVMSSSGDDDVAEEEGGKHDERETNICLRDAVLHCPHNEYKYFGVPERGVTFIGSIYMTFTSTASFSSSSSSSATNVASAASCESSSQTPSISTFQPVATLTVHFPTTGVVQTYDIAAAGSSGDSWTSGGVSQTLSACINDCCRRSDPFRRFETSPPVNVPSCAAGGCKLGVEEGLRDCLVVDALLQHSATVSRRRLSGEFSPLLTFVQPLSYIEGVGVPPLRPRPPSPPFALGPFVNSTGTSIRTYDAVARASCVREVSMIMQRAGVLGGSEASVEVAGAENAMSEGGGIEDSKGAFRIRLELTSFQRLIHFDEAAGVVKVEAGMSLRKLVEILLKNGYQLPSLPILLDQTIGGCISTGSHGSSCKYGTVSDSVCGVTVVADTGGVMCYREDGTSTNEEILRLLRCGLGLVGAICEVELRVERLRRFVRHEVSLSCVKASMAIQIRELGEKYEHVWVHWRLGTGSVAICLEAVNVSLDAPGQPYDGRNWYPFSSELDKLVEGPSDRKGTRKFTQQFSFPMIYLERVLDAVAGMNNSIYTGRIVELKFLAASIRTAFAPNSVSANDSGGEPFVCVNVWWDCHSSDELKLFETTMQAIDSSARIHFGKWHDSRCERKQSAATICQQGRVVMAREAVSIQSPVLSIILPVYNAMPYFPLALRDVLKQGVPKNNVEVVVSDDCSKDGSYEFMLELVALLKDRAEIVVDDLVSTQVDAQVSNPALLLPARPQTAEISSAAASVRPPEIEAIFQRPLTPAEVAASIADGVRLKFVVQGGVRKNMGQGATMSRCLKHTTGEFIGFMESDDERDAGNYAEMLKTLMEDARADGVCCSTQCIGWKREGMERYIEWQNGLLDAAAVRRSRFIEIPTLMQAAVVTREAAWRATGGTGAFRDDQKWAVDMHFWLLFFGAGCEMKRVTPAAVGRATTTQFLWRQHPGQQTRRHGRLSVENLRKCKCEFIVQDFIIDKEIGYVEIWSVGTTLEGWAEDMREAIARAGLSGISVVPFPWHGSSYQPTSTVPATGGGGKRVRLFAFGMQKARDKVRRAFESSWNDEFDVFVA